MNPARQRAAARPFRRAVFSGLGVLLPPLLTIVILLWIYNTVREYVLHPVEAGVRYSLAWAIQDVRTSLPDRQATENPAIWQSDGARFALLPTREYIPEEVYDRVEASGVKLGNDPPRSGFEYYEIFAELEYLPSYKVVPVFLCMFVLALYFLGRFLAAGIGRVFWNLFERLILQLPLVRNVYSSVKQVTDMMFSERELEFSRVVAVEYPRRGTWTLGFVTGEGLADVRAAANEPMLSIMVPSSPWLSGYTLQISRSEVVDLNMTIDQACQYLISCGVVVPEQQLVSVLEKSRPFPGLPRNNGDPARQQPESASKTVSDAGEQAVS